ncbi:DUF4852 domain-containing protein [Aliarcobacter butzleri]|uniref:DUF4852 domain-containing protein n=1 Tax=Aliarcobacter butzleri TaxID=28197 RepID=UPI00126053FD|nr:DUF4852 domain-containing protein [Aliarcobacter butzleri]MCT7562160.1 DUF4852 domain-containing protein [Aliarcobacter butzleri]
MKKSVVLLSCLASFLFADIDFTNRKDVDKLAMAGLKDSINNIDEKSGGLWYLYRAQTTKWDKVKNDEFEIQDAISKAYPLFKNTIEKNQELIGKQTVVLVGVNFQDYDFSKESFEIGNLLDEKSYLEFYGDEFSNGIKLSFDNTNAQGTFLAMNKEDAKQFVQKRKNSYGEVNRKLIAKYYFKIKSISSFDKNVIGCVYSKGRTNNCNALSTSSVVGHIEKIEILDDKNKVISTYSYQ